jgi:hypothetical protein
MRLPHSVVGAVLWLLIPQVMAGQNRLPNAPAIETGFLNRTIRHSHCSLRRTAKNNCCR